MKSIPSENVAKVQDSWHQQGFFVMQNGIHYLIGSIIRFHDGKKQRKSEGVKRNSMPQIILYRIESLCHSHITYREYALKEELDRLILNCGTNNGLS